MTNPTPTPLKPDRRGSWKRATKAAIQAGTVAPLGALSAPAPPRDPIAFINSLTHTKGAFAGQTFNLRPWQRPDSCGSCSRSGRDGRRQYRTCLLMLPRKNGKTELAAAVALYGLLADGEAGRRGVFGGGGPGPGRRWCSAWRRR